MLMAFISPVFATGELNVTATSLAPVFANTNTSVTALNLTFNVTQAGGSGTVNITAILVNISSATAGNVSFVELRNSTGATLGINSTVSTDTGFLINITGGFEVTTAANKSMTIVLNVSRSATRQLNVSINITTSGIFTNETGNNITFKSSSGTISNSSVSNGVQIQDMHVNGTISPRFVDTSVENQTFAYTLGMTGTDPISSITLNIPSGYTLINLTAVEQIGTGNLTSNLFTNTTLSNQLNITFATATAQNFKIYFIANTSSSATATSLFNLTVTGSNMTNIMPDPTSSGSMNITKQQILNVDNVAITKAVAIVNGTDYWEFNLTINYTATVSTGGMIQFKLSNWTNADRRNLSLTSTSADASGFACSVTNCATLRNDVNFSAAGKFNLTNTYESTTKGISVSSTAANSTVTVILRMVLPLATPISSTWQTTYGILFRSSP